MTASFTLLVLSSKDRGASSPSILYPKEESGSHCLLILDLKPRSAGLKFGSTIRHSFATSVCLSQGVPIETLSQMMGHQDIATTQIYAEITRTKINEDMSKLAETIQGKYELPENDCKIHKIRRNRRFPERENNEDNI